VGQHVVLGRAGDRVAVRRDPGIGESLVEWIRGDYYISDITLNRFFALHVVACHWRSFSS
jgi:quinol-cytochrome oxidoreductase complex cytochrome b subunit